MKKTLIISMIKKYYKLLLSILIVQALGCTIMIALSSSHKSLEKSLNKYVEDYNYPEAYITTELTSREKVEQFKEQLKISPRLTFDTIVKHDGTYLSARVLTFGDQDFYKFYEWESKDVEGIYLEYNFAHDNHISVGDKVAFKLGDEYREFTVSKIVSTPETLSIESSNQFTGFNEDFGYAYVKDEIVIKELEKEYDQKKEDIVEKENELEENKREAENEYASAKSNLSYYENLINEENEKLQTLKTELDKADITLEEVRSKVKQLESSKKELQKALDELNTKKNQLLDIQNTLNEIDKTIQDLTRKYEQLQDLKEVIELLDSLPKDTRIDRFVKEIIFINNLNTKLHEYGMELDLNGKVWQVAERIDALTNQISADSVYLNLDSTKEYIRTLPHDKNTEAYRTLFTTLKRYDPLLNDQNLEERIPMIYDRVATLKNIIDNSEGISLIKTIGSVEEVTFLEVVQVINENQEAIKKFRTIQDLINGYNDGIESIKTTLEELKEGRKNLIEELKKAGIQEEEIPVYLQTLDESIQEVEANQTELEKVYQEALTLYNTINSNKSQYESKYQDGLNQITTSQEELNTKKNQLQDEYLRSLRIYNEAREEIEEAYRTLKDKYNYNNYCNEFLLQYQSEKPYETLKETEEKLGVEVKNSYIYEDSNVKKRIDINLQPIETMSTFLPMVFFLIVLIVIFLFMSLLIKQCRKEIGILRALGYSKWKIRMFFCTLIFLLSICAIVLGMLISMILIAYTGTTYQNFFPIPFFTYLLNNKMFLIAVLATFVVSILATLISTISIDQIKPAEAMSREIPDNKKNPKVINNLNISPFSKFSIISLLRNKTKFIFSCICISACVMMIFSAFSFISSKNYILDELYNKRIQYDAQIYFKDQVDSSTLDGLNQLEYVSDAQFVSYYDTEVSANEKSKKVIINGIKPDTKLINIYNQDQIEMPENGIVLEKHLADYLGVSKGDQVTIKDHAYEITAISDQSLNRINYLSEEEAKNLGGSQISSIILNIEEGKEDNLLEYLSEKDDYLYTIFTSRSHNSLLKTFKTYDLAAWIIVGFAIIIGFVIILNTSLTNLLEQKKKLSLIKALGQQYSEISKNWFIQSLIQYVIALIVGFPVGVWIAKVSLQKLSTENREYVFVNHISMYIITALLVFTYIVISHMISMRTLKSWDISENMKERE